MSVIAFRQLCWSISFGYASAMRVISKGVPVFLVLNLSLPSARRRYRSKAVTVDHRLQAEGHANLNAAAVFDEPHLCVVGGNERFSSAAFRGKRNRTPSTLPLPDRANSTRHGAILRRELAHR